MLRQISFLLFFFKGQQRLGTGNTEQKIFLMLLSKNPTALSSAEGRTCFE